MHSASHENKKDQCWERIISLKAASLAHNTCDSLYDRFRTQHFKRVADMQIDLSAVSDH